MFGQIWSEYLHVLYFQCLELINRIYSMRKLRQISLDFINKSICDRVIKT